MPGQEDAETEIDKIPTDEDQEIGIVIPVGLLDIVVADIKEERTEGNQTKDRRTVESFPEFDSVAPP